jgi:hypothetical protein
MVQIDLSDHNDLNDLQETESHLLLVVRHERLQL